MIDRRLYAKRRRSAGVWLLLFLVLALLRPNPGVAAPPQETPAPSPAPTASDPCGGPGRLLATANRPTVGFSPCAVKDHTAVFELGYQNQVNGTPANGSVQAQVPQNFLRLGVAPRFELDVIGPNYEATKKYAAGAPTTLTNGVADSGLGFKYELPSQGRWTMAFDGLYTGPNGSPFLTAGNATLTGNLDASFAMSPCNESWVDDRRSRRPAAFRRPRSWGAMA